MNFEIFVDDGEVDYVNRKSAIVKQRLQQTLYLLIAELHAADIKRDVPIGHGFSDAPVETARKAEAAKQWHQETFGDTDAQARQIQESIGRNTRVREK